MTLRELISRMTDLPEILPRVNRLDAALMFLMGFTAAVLTIHAQWLLALLYAMMPVWWLRGLEDGYRIATTQKRKTRVARITDRIGFEEETES